MKNWKLERFAYVPNKGAFSKLTIPYIGEFYTIEQDWENNKPSHSCIPCGEYELSLYMSPARSQEVILLRNDYLLSLGDANGTPRSYIEMHPGNWIKDIKGCIAPGERLGDSWNVVNSRNVMDILLEVLRGNPEATLEVLNRDSRYDGNPT